MTRRNFSVEYRPNRLSEMVGQDELVSAIRGHFASGTVPLGILLTGSFGAGKTTLARILALSFNCSHQEQFGEPCDACIENADLYNIIERNCADLTTIDAMRDLLPILQTYPTYGPYRVIIPDEAQQVSDKAQQVLLKPLEEKDSHNIFIFCTSDPTKINQAVKDRCIPFAVPDLSKAGVEAVVRYTIEKAEVDIPDNLPEFLTAVYTAQLKNPRNVITATEKFLGGAQLHEAIVIKEAGPIDYYTLFRYASQGDWEKCRAILSLARPADGTEIKTRMAAHFRDYLVKTPAGSRADLLSSFIRELAENNVIEAGLQLSATVSTIYRICQTVASVKQQAPSNTIAYSSSSATIH